MHHAKFPKKRKKGKYQEQQGNKTSHKTIRTLKNSSSSSKNNSRNESNAVLRRQEYSSDRSYGEYGGQRQEGGNSICIHINGKNRRLGTYATEVEAARAFDASSSLYSCSSYSSSSSSSSCSSSSLVQARPQQNRSVAMRQPLVGLTFVDWVKEEEVASRLRVKRDSDERHLNEEEDEEDEKDVDEYAGI